MARAYVHSTGRKNEIVVNRADGTELARFAAPDDPIAAHRNREAMQNFIDCVAEEANSQPVRERGVDFACESCGALIGSVLVNGFHRCKHCGYPGK